MKEDFIETVQEEGVMEDFCEERDADTGECVTKLREELEGTSHTNSVPEEEQQVVDTEKETAPGTEEEMATPEFDDSVETMVEDCFGQQTRVGGFVRNPNMHACKRLFERQQREISDLKGN